MKKLICKIFGHKILFVVDIETFGTITTVEYCKRCDEKLKFTIHADKNMISLKEFTQK